MLYRPIRNSAQLSPAAVQFRSCAPDIGVAPYLAEFWQYDVIAPRPWARIQVFPSGCVVLRFDISASDVKPVIYGPSLRPDMKSVFVAGVSAFGVALRLERAPAVVGCEISELRDQRLGLEGLWPGATLELCDRLWREPDFLGRVAILARFLQRRIHEQKAPHADFLRAVQYLSRGGFSAALPRHLASSQRTLRRTFDSNVGISPKQLGRIIRVQTAMQELTRRPGTRCSRLALDVGFSDQPHFNREFKRILGLSPGAFSRSIGRFHEAALPIWTSLNRRLEQRAGPDPETGASSVVPAPRPGAIGADAPAL